MILDNVIFIFFILGEWVWVLESMEIYIFFFEPFPIHKKYFENRNIYLKHMSVSYW